MTSLTGVEFNCMAATQGTHLSYWSFYSCPLGSWRQSQPHGG